MSLVSSVIVMTSAWDEELFAEIKAGFKDDMHSLPRDFKEMDMSKCGGTKHMEVRVFACGANYMDETVFIPWAIGLRNKLGGNVGIMYTTNGSLVKYITQDSEAEDY